MFDLFADRTFVFRMRAEVRPCATLLRANGNAFYFRLKPLP